MYETISCSPRYVGAVNGKKISKTLKTLENERFEYLRGDIQNSGKIQVEIYVFNEPPHNINYGHQTTIVDDINSILYFQGYNIISFSGNLIINITGVFENELLPPTGDLNLDGEVNVVDVVVLVNSILEG